MAKKDETKEVAGPKLETQDIAVLYTLAQQATVKVADIETVSSVINKCKMILLSENQKG